MYGKFWTRWNDAVREAGLEPNRMSEAYETDYLLEKLASLTHHLARVPTQGDLLLAARNDPTFPSEKAFRRLGSKSQRVAKMIRLCEDRADLAGVAALWREVPAPRVTAEAPESTPTTIGYVYLLKHGSRREYKIGRTYNPLRREGEVGIELPERIRPIHYIETDDPAGIEAYWHHRFASKRKEGEWFALTPDDVRAFKRWKRIN